MFFSSSQHAGVCGVLVIVVCTWYSDCITEFSGECSIVMWKDVRSFAFIAHSQWALHSLFGWHLTVVLSKKCSSLAMPYLITNIIIVIIITRATALFSGPLPIALHLSHAISVIMLHILCIVFVRFTIRSSNDALACYLNLKRILLRNQVASATHAPKSMHSPHNRNGNEIRMQWRFHLIGCMHKMLNESATNSVRMCLESHLLHWRSSSLRKGNF